MVRSEGAEPLTIGDSTRIPIRNVVGIVVASVALAGWMTAVKYDLSGFERALDRAVQELTTRMDNLTDAVKSIDGSRIHSTDMIYWIGLLRKENPTLQIPDFPVLSR